MIKKIVFTVLFFTAFISFSQQKSVNNYKYVIVPTQFDFLSSPDQYQLNSLTKFLFDKYGFKAFLSDEQLPEDLAKNRCLALTATVKNNSGMFTTKNKVELKDCYNNVVYTSTEGKSKQKEYKKAFQEAVRNAFKSIQALHYKYNGEIVAVEAPTEPTNPIKSTVPVSVEFPTKETPQPTKPVIKDTKNVLYAQAITNGFQLVNTKPEVVFQVLKSSKKDFYFLKNKDGVLFKKGTNWIAEYYENDTLVQKQYQVKF